MPLETTGDNAKSICAFARHYNDSIVLVIVPRLVAGIMDAEGELHLKRKLWGNSYVVVPSPGQPGDVNVNIFRDVFTAETLETKKHAGQLCLPVHELFNNFPVAMLINVMKRQ